MSNIPKLKVVGESTFVKEVTVQDGLIATGGDIIISQGGLTFTDDDVDVTIIDKTGITTNKISSDEIYLSGNPISNFVVETYIDDNGNWYRKYPDGWIEQGGTGYTGTALSFPMPFTNVPTLTLGEYNDSNANAMAVGYNNLSSTGFKPTRYSNGLVITVKWFACGY